MDKRIYRFGGDAVEGLALSKADRKTLLGGKGASLVEMTEAGLNVPPGFTITTAVCNEYQALKAADKVKFLKDLMTEVADHMTWLAGQFGYMPLVSVRSGAPVSMPGMMDTILNVGMTEGFMNEWQDRLGERPALDSRRRLIQMMGSTAYGVDHDKFEFQLASVKKIAGAKIDADLTAAQLVEVIDRFEDVFEKNVGHAFPDEIMQQVEAGIVAVFGSWNNERAVIYRNMNKLDHTMGTAVNVQAMVFGNMGDDSGTGVLFTRNPSSGQPGMFGEYLENAQGEDVVAGIRTPLPIQELEHGAGEVWAKVYADLLEVCSRLEAHYRDMVDIEFTVQKGKLFILQSRAGKRSAQAAFKIAVDMVSEGLIDVETALSRLSVDQFKTVRRPMIDPKFDVKPNLTGLPACPGIAVGKPVFSSEAAVKATEPVILVTHETTPDDIAGMAKAAGILTKTGGATSHAAVVARAMDKPCVVGCMDALDLDALKAKGGMITIDGATGNAWFGIDVPVIDGSNSHEVKQVMAWCLKAMNACEATAAPLDGEAHRIMAAHWWGDEDVLSAVLQVLCDMPSREGITLDMTPPAMFRHLADDALFNCFGQEQEKVAFHEAAMSKIGFYGKKLAGLTLVGFDDKAAWTAPAAKSFGVRFPKQAQNVDDLLQTDQPVTVGPGFVKHVCGTDNAFHQLMEALRVAGVRTSVVAKGVPADYAAFTVLSQ